MNNSIDLDVINRFSSKYKVDSNNIIESFEELGFKRYNNKLIFLPDITKDLKYFFEDVSKNIFNLPIGIYFKTTKSNNIIGLLPNLFKIYSYKPIILLTDYMNFYGNNFDKDFINEAKKYIKSDTKFSVEEMLHYYKFLASGCTNINEDVMKLVMKMNTITITQDI